MDFIPAGLLKHNNSGFLLDEVPDDKELGTLREPEIPVFKRTVSQPSAGHHMSTEQKLSLSF